MNHKLQTTALSPVLRAGPASAGDSPGEGTRGPRPSPQAHWPLRAGSWGQAPPAKAQAWGPGWGGLGRAGMPQVHGGACLSLCQNTGKLLEARRHPPLNKKAVKGLQVAGTRPLPPAAAGPGSSAVGVGVALLPVGQDRGQQGTGRASGRLSQSCPTADASHRPAHAPDPQPSSDGRTARTGLAVGRDVAGRRLHGCGALRSTG